MTSERPFSNTTWWAHKSYPDFVMKYRNGKFHMFEVKTSTSHPGSK